MLQLLQPGDHVLCIDDLYGGTGRLLRHLAPKMGFTWDAADTADPVAFAGHMKAGPSKTTKLVWLESPTNPLMKVRAGG